MEADLEAAQDTKGKKVSKQTIQTRKQRVMDKWIPPDPTTPVKGRFKDPAVGAFSGRK